MASRPHSLGGSFEKLPPCISLESALINNAYRDPITGTPQSGQAAVGNGCEEDYGDTYQNGVRPGAAKLAQFLEVLAIAGTPELGKVPSGQDSIVHVRLFDPSGSWTWYLTEFESAEPHHAFGLVCGHESELGYVDLVELAHAKGKCGLGIELDMHFRPTLLATVRAERETHAN